MLSIFFLHSRTDWSRGPDCQRNLLECRAVLENAATTHSTSVDVQPALVLELFCCLPEDICVVLLVQFNVDPQLIARLVVRHEAQPFWHSLDVFPVHPVNIDVHCPGLSVRCRYLGSGVDHLHCSSSFWSHVICCCPAMVLGSKEFMDQRERSSLGRCERQFWEPWEYQAYHRLC